MDPAAKVEVDQSTLVRLVRVLRKESDGKELRKDLVRELKSIAEPAAAAARASILSMPSTSRRVVQLRPAIAKGVRVSVRTGGRRAGVSIRASKRGMPRDFVNAPKKLNSPGWRHPFFGDRSQWYAQVGKPGWFDESIKPFKPAAVKAASEALAAVARRIDERTKG